MAILVSCAEMLDPIKVKAVFEAVVPSRLL